MLFPIDTIGHHPGINVTELAKNHKITKSAVSQAVKKFEKRELIIRSKAPGNLKEVLFSLTETGRIAYKAHTVFHEKIELATGSGSICNLSHNFFPDIEKALINIRKVLKPESVFIGSVPVPEK